MSNLWITFGCFFYRKSPTPKRSSIFFFCLRNNLFCLQCIFVLISLKPFLFSLFLFIHFSSNRCCFLYFLSVILSCLQPSIRQSQLCYSNCDLSFFNYNIFPYLNILWAWIAQLIQRLATSWTTRASNPCRGEIFPPVQTGPGADPASYTKGTGSFPGVK